MFSACTKKQRKVHLLGTETVYRTKILNHHRTSHGQQSMNELQSLYAATKMDSSVSGDSPELSSFSLFSAVGSNSGVFVARLWYSGASLDLKKINKTIHSMRSQGNTKMNHVKEAHVILVLRKRHSQSFLVHHPLDSYCSLFRVQLTHSLKRTIKIHKKLPRDPDS